MIKVSDVIAIMDIIAPSRMAASGDPVGLHIGSRGASVKKIMVVLDATIDAVREAKRLKCNMIIAHHPRIYRPLVNIDESSMMGAIVAEAIRANISVFCAHTNLDAAPGGVNDTLADLAGIVDAKVVKSYSEDRFFKLVVFVPEPHIDEVRNAVCDAGAGVIGEYEDCSYRTLGIGSFRGSESSKPYIGSSGEYEEIEEWRLEVRLPESVKHAVVSALREVHPYEEPAYDIYPLDAKVYEGCGRYGKLKKSITLKTLASRMKKSCASTETLVLGDLDKKLSSLAVWSGGGCPVAKVVRLGVDAVVLGEVGYHDTEILWQAGVGCIRLGHGPSEEVVLPVLADNLRMALPEVEVVVYTDGTPRMRAV